MNCPYLDGKCGDHAQCVKCKAGAKSPRSKRDPYTAFLEYAFFFATVFIIIWLMCEMAFN